MYTDNETMKISTSSGICKIIIVTPVCFQGGMKSFTFMGVKIEGGMENKRRESV